MAEPLSTLPDDNRVARALLLLAVLTVLVTLGCRQNPSQATGAALRVAGETMGTTYHLTLVDARADGAAVKRAVDSLLAAINAEVNTYDPRSLISRYNAGESLRARAGEPAYGAHLLANLRLAREVHHVSKGAFDPSVGPLVEYYGFGAGLRDSAAVDERVVDSLLKFVGFDLLADSLVGTERWLLERPGDAGFRLDLSAVAKGYAVDEVSALLAARFGSADHLVEIGGETVVRGLSPRGTPWRTGVNTPRADASTRDVELVVELSEAGLATSGNYRNARTRGGERYVHTVDPRTGAARASRLLSATVVAGRCAVADAYATACMVSGERAREVLAKAQLDGCLIFAAGGGTFDIEYVGDFERYVQARRPQDRPQ